MTCRACKVLFVFAFVNLAASWRVAVPYRRSSALHYSGVERAGSHSAVRMRHIDSFVKRSPSPESHGASRTSAMHKLKQLLTSAAVGSALLLGIAGDPQAAAAGQLTPEQELVAEAWFTTDRFFGDRTFNGQDWFKTRERLVKKSYSDKTAAYEEIIQMLNSLNDKYTRFLKPELYKGILSKAESEAVGIGTVISKPPTATSEPVVVTTVVDGSPAAEAGLLAGDKLLQVDGASTLQMSNQEVGARIRGPEQSFVRIVWSRPGQEGTTDKVLKREKVKIRELTTEVKMVDGKKVGYIDLQLFSTQSASDIKQAINSFNGPQALVLDLRECPGGYMQGGAEVAKLFFKKDTPVVNVIDVKQGLTSVVSYEDGPFTDLPVYILVSENTASASEIFTAAMQDNARAKVIGKQTYGKGIIQTVIALSDGSAIAVTTSQYRTPKGTNLNRVGIFPDETRECPKGVAAVNCFPI